MGAAPSEAPPVVPLAAKLALSVERGVARMQINGGRGYGYTDTVKAVTVSIHDEGECEE